MKLQIYKIDTWVELPIINSSYTLTEVLYNNLQQSDNSISLKIDFDSTISDFLRSSTDDYIPAKVLNDDNTSIFTGYIRNNFTFTKKQRNQPIKLELVSQSYLLDVELTDGFTLYNNSVSTIVETLVKKVDYSIVVEIPPDALINKTVKCFVAESEENVKDILNDLLFEFGYTFDFDSTGQFVYKELFEQVITSTITNNFNGDNCLESIKIEKDEKKYKNVAITYNKTEHLTDKLIFEDTQNATDTESCVITVDGNEWLYGEEGNYLEYDCKDGAVLGIETASLSIEKDDDLEIKSQSNKGTNYYLSIKNNSATEKHINKLQITGTGYFQTGINVLKSYASNNADSIYEYTCKYIDNKDDADNLKANLKNYYDNSVFKITVTSKIDIDVGSFCSVSDTGIGTTYCKVIKKVKKKTDSKSYTYTLNSISDWTPTETYVKSVKKFNSAIGTSGKDGVDGLNGADGTDGTKGDDGTSVTNVTSYFYSSTSKTSQTGGSWVTTCPTWTSGHYLWKKLKVSYSNGSTEYTEPEVDSSWEAVNDVGQENLIRMSAFTGIRDIRWLGKWKFSLISGTAIHGSSDVFGISYENNTQYTLSLTGYTSGNYSSSTGLFYISATYTDGTYDKWALPMFGSGGWKDYTYTTLAGKTLSRFGFTFGNIGTERVQFKNVMLSKTDHKVEWSPSPYDFETSNTNIGGINLFSNASFDNNSVGSFSYYNSINTSFSTSDVAISGTTTFIQSFSGTVGDDINRGIRLIFWTSSNGKQYTLSFYGKGWGDLGLYWGDGFTLFRNDQVSYGDWIRYVITFTFSSSSSQWLYIRPTNNKYTSSSYTLYLNAPQLEEGSYCTGWKKSNSDSYTPKYLGLMANSSTWTWTDKEYTGHSISADGIISNYTHDTINKGDWVVKYTYTAGVYYWSGSKWTSTTDSKYMTGAVMQDILALKKAGYTLSQWTAYTNLLVENLFATSITVTGSIQSDNFSSSNTGITGFQLVGSTGKATINKGVFNNITANGLTVDGDVSFNNLDLTCEAGSVLLRNLDDISANCGHSEIYSQICGTGSVRVSGHYVNSYNPAITDNYLYIGVSDGSNDTIKKTYHFTSNTSGTFSYDVSINAGQSVLIKAVSNGGGVSGGSTLSLTEMGIGTNRSCGVLAYLGKGSSSTTIIPSR